MTFSAPVERGLNQRIYGESAITATITWTAGTAPSGASSLYMIAERVGRTVLLQIRLEYAVAGSTITGVDIDLPSTLPLPLDMTGVADGEMITAGASILTTNMTSNTSQGRCILIKDSGSATGYKIRNFATSGSFIGAVISINYITA